MCATHYSRWRLHGDPLTTVGPSPEESAAERLAKSTGPRTPTGCREWTGHRDKNGYGTVRYRGRRYKAHVLAFLVSSGQPLEPGFIVRHTCDNPPCLDEGHLLLGTHADNAADRVARNRSAHPLGEQNPQAKLTAKSVVQVRLRLAAGESCTSIARSFDVNRKTISKIANNLTWKEAA